MFASKEAKKEVEDSLKNKLEILATKLNLVSREEFEIQKKMLKKLQKDLINLNKKIKIRKKSKKAKKS